ncbi:glycosyltransferase family 2 protein [Niabella hibiscisoli]|uniref:glycosyltransferase family 2 protein n=1 Tax=Niabella hibiscisoli TaxID=1825928 RepID=UPI001F102D22|nr:glycosyltransferase family 2 protein [Niabella hibiscisoli]MCH5718092.1 glycosyltransferase family 2 protein [Niabella hibiscisoli]
MLTAMMKRLLIVIPSYNEETALPKLLNELKTTVFLNSFTVVPLVVNDCSKDKTELVAKHNGGNVLSLVNNLGIGGAVQAGIKYAKRHGFDYVLQMDGDGQHPPAEVNKLLQAALDTQADVVIGSRFLNKQGFQTSLMRRFGIKYFHWLNRLLTHKSIYDTTSGFRLMGARAINLAASYYPDDYPEPESLIFFSRAGLIIKEVPVIMRERQGGKSSIAGFSSLYYMMKVSLSSILSYVRKI